MGYPMESMHVTVAFSVKCSDCQAMPAFRPISEISPFSGGSEGRFAAKWSGRPLIPQKAQLRSTTDQVVCCENRSSYKRSFQLFANFPVRFSLRHLPVFALSASVTR